MALRHADRVAGLVLVGTVAAFGGGSPEFVERYLADRLAPLDAGRSPADFAGTTIASLVAAPLTAADHHRAVSAMSAISPDAYRAGADLPDDVGPPRPSRRDRRPDAGRGRRGRPDRAAQGGGPAGAGHPRGPVGGPPATGHLVNLEAPAAFHDAARRLAGRPGGSRLTARALTSWSRPRPGWAPSGSHPERPRTTSTPGSRWRTTTISGRRISSGCASRSATAASAPTSRPTASSPPSWADTAAPPP